VLENKRGTKEPLIGCTSAASQFFEEARCQLNVKGEHMNALGGVHGGVIFSLADIAFAMACNVGDAP